MGWYYGFKPYVPVAQRRAQAARYAAALAKKEKRQLAPVAIEGRTIAQSFWGQAWCDNLECYSDFSNRLPRGRTYVRNGSVLDLQIAKGEIKALVSGSEVYRVKINIKTLAGPLWKKIKQDCGRSVASLIDLLQGRFDQAVMQRLTQRDGGLFPTPREIELHCSCPDDAGMCKHVAAVLYGVGARLDAAPEMLFLLRHVDHLELIEQAGAAENLARSLAATGDSTLAGSDLGQMFGIELDQAAKPAKRRKSLTRATSGAPAAARKLPAAKKRAVKRNIIEKRTAKKPAVAHRQRSRRKPK